MRCRVNNDRRSARSKIERPFWFLLADDLFMSLRPTLQFSRLFFQYYHTAALCEKIAYVFNIVTGVLHVHLVSPTPPAQHYSYYRLSRI